MSPPDLADLFTPSGAVMFAAGYLTRRAWCWAKNKKLDRQDPAGAPHRDKLKTVTLAWGIFILAMVYMGVRTQVTHNETLALARNVSHCWSESYQATKAQIDNNAANNDITRKQLKLQRDYDRANSAWIKELIQPPGDLADQPTTSPARQAWGIAVTNEYQDKLDDLGTQADALDQERTKLDQERAQHPLPETTCGKS